MNSSEEAKNLIQAILAVDDLFCLAAPHVMQLFPEDVTQWLDDEDIRYTPQVKFAGKTGFDHMFDFAIPKSKASPEWILKTVNNPGKGKAEELVFHWMDTKETRSASSVLYAILNDHEREVSTNMTDALHRYGIHAIPWSKRKDFTKELIA